MEINYCPLLDRKLDPIWCVYETRKGASHLCSSPYSKSKLCEISKEGPPHSVDEMRELNPDIPPTEVLIGRRFVQNRARKSEPLDLSVIEINHITKQLPPTPNSPFKLYHVKKRRKSATA